MHRTLLALVILLRLATAPSARADEPVSDMPSLASAAARQAQAATLDPPAQPRRPMDKGSMWTGIGMLSLSAPIALAATIGDCLGSEGTCDDQQRAAYVASGILAGSGAALLTYAHVQRLGPEPGPDAKMMRPGLKWTGIGLLVGGTLSWAANEQITCGANGGCKERQEARQWIAASMAGAGAVVLTTGFATRRTAWPSVVVTPGRAYVQQRISF
jgi:hypothetical protein